MGARGKTPGVLGAATLLAVLLTGCVPVLVGSPDLETREFDFAGFTHIEVGSAFEVEVSRSDSFVVSITLNENLFDRLDISQRGKTLVIRMRPGFSFRRSTLRASISLPDLQGLQLSGASRGTVTGFSSTRPLQLGVSGASSLELIDITAGDTRFDVSGASSVTGSITIADGDFDVSGASSIDLDGTAADINLSVSGASSARLGSFPVVNGSISISGASNATIEASGNLDIAASGASRLVYSGSPTLGRISVSGGSTVHHK
jgi:hypothetical protein